MTGWYSITMLTMFTTAKPFAGHSAMIQRNALESWRRLPAEVEIILFGDDAGTAEVCAELGLRHEPNVERREGGTKSVRSIFRRAQEIARHDVICYSNCDIVLTSDFVRAIEAVASWRNDFLMIGRRWDTDITESIDFSRPEWQSELVERARREGFQRLYYNIDYFAFRRGLYGDFPDLVIGRNWWDQWLVWKAGARGAVVVDASEVVCAVHQNHDYSYHPRGMAGVWNDERTQRNFREAGGWGRLHTMEDARYRLTLDGIEPNRGWWLAPAKRHVRSVRKAVRTFLRTRLWHLLLDKTRSLRHALGLRQSALGPPRRRNSVRRHRLDQ